MIGEWLGSYDVCQFVSQRICDVLRPMGATGGNLRQPEATWLDENPMNLQKKSPLNFMMKKISRHLS